MNTARAGQDALSEQTARHNNTACNRFIGQYGWLESRLNESLLDEVGTSDRLVVCMHRPDDLQPERQA